MTYQEAKDIKTNLETAVSIASATLKAFPKGPLGLTPDSVKATAEYQAAKEQHDRCTARLREYNTMFLKTFKREYAQERRNRTSSSVS